MAQSAHLPESITFGSFRLLPHRRALFADDAPVKLGGRAFDLLIALIATPGAIIAKDELMARVWPDRIATENNLQAQILALRQALGAERNLVRTIPGRGYQFIGPIHIAYALSDKPVAAALIVEGNARAARSTNLPQAATELIGRDTEVIELANLVHAFRLVTLTGAGGIGKTRLALAVGHGLMPHFPDGVWLAEFSPLADPRLVPATVAAAVGLELSGELSTQRVAQALAARRMLLVLDTCEHVIDAAAAMAEAALQVGSTIHVIATSREPLRAEGEHRYPVAPLAMPADDAADILEFGAARLFVERARAAGADLLLDPTRAAIIKGVCWRLDGIPLAIEMAAARVAALGVDELAGRLGGRLPLLSGGRRTALPRHQTLRATLDWSHGLLAESDRVILRRIGIFPGTFSLAAAAAIVASPEIAASEIIDGISSLVEKSLLVAELDGAMARYRLLDTTRGYALDKLTESGERELLARRHAEYFRTLLELAEAELETSPTVGWVGNYRWQIGSLRAALDWAFSSGGDIETGAALTAAAVPLWLLLSLFDECRDRVETAVIALGTGATGDARRAMKLYAALGACAINGASTKLLALDAAWSRALEIAERLGVVEYQLRALWGLWVANWASGQHRIALRLAHKFTALAAGSDANDQLIGERMVGVSELLLGELSSARHRLEHMLANYVSPAHTAQLIRFHTDQRVVASVFLARVLWLQGFPEQALRAAGRSVDDARSSGHAMSLAYILAHGAYPIALWAGDLDLAEQYAARLDELATTHSLVRWRAFGDRHRGMLAIERGAFASGLRLLRPGLGEFGDVNAAFGHFLFFGHAARAWAGLGQIEAALAELAKAIARAGETEERWGIAELLRINGELLLLQDAPGAAASAEDQFRHGFDWARRQGALSWQLRIAISFARLLRDQGRSADGSALLQSAYDRFTEGFATADLKAARVLLDELP